MRDAVRESFYDFSTPMEGAVPYFYPDVKGLVSIGVGLLCDPIQLALNLPLVKEDGTPAGRDEIAAEWLRIKNLPPDAKGRTAAQLGHRYAKLHTKLRLTDDGLRFTLARKLAQQEVEIIKGFPDWESWCCDAQMATLSLAWAVGPRFWDPGAGKSYFPKLTRALRLRDYETASRECFLPEERTISGLRPRNKANRTLFMNATIVEQSNMNHESLFYPRDLTALEIEDDVSTLPELPSSEPEPASVIVRSLHLAGLPGVGDDEPPEAA
jgi:hypothetical protein